MSILRRLPSRAFVLSTFALLIPLTASVEAGWPRARRVRAVAPRAYVADSDPSEPFGSFYRTPYVYVRGNYPAGGGYSPLGEYGPNSLSLDGPLSAFRTTTAPVAVQTRGYDGTYRTTIGTTLSYPNLPRVAPTVYPTRANVDPRLRRQHTPPWWDSATGWIDLN